MLELTSPGQAYLSRLESKWRDSRKSLSTSDMYDWYILQRVLERELDPSEVEYLRSFDTQTRSRIRLSVARLFEGGFLKLRD